MEQELKGQYSNFFGTYSKIYTLADENGNVFYVGATIQNLEDRFAQHISEARRNEKNSNPRKRAVIRSLNYNVVATIIDMKWVTADVPKYARLKSLRLERDWIKKYLSLGYDLVNRRIKGFDVKDKVKPEFVGQAFKSSVDKIEILAEKVNAVE